MKNTSLDEGVVEIIFNKFFHPVTPICCMAFTQFYYLREMLFFQTVSVLHDSVKPYAFFHFFVQNLQNGVYPLWSPHTHAGEPFWPFIQIFGLTQPTVSLMAILGIIFPSLSIGLLYHWHLFLAILIFNVFTCFFVLEFFSPHLRGTAAWILAPIAFFGSFTVLSFHSFFGTIAIATYFPLILFITLKLFKLIKKEPPVTLPLCLSLLLGLSISFQLTSNNPVFFLIAYSVTLFPLMLEANLTLKCLYRHKFILLSGLLISGLFSGPAFLLLKSEKDFFPIARHDSQKFLSKKGTEPEFEGFFTRKDTISGHIGTTAEFSDPLRSLFPNRNDRFENFGFILGYSGAVLAIVGLVFIFSKTPLGIGFSLLTLTLLSFGSNTFLGRFFYSTVPFFNSIRHTAFFLIFAFPLILYFVALGWSKLTQRISGKYYLLVLGISFLIIFFFSKRDYFKWRRLQPIPYSISNQFPYLGNHYQESRSFTVTPFKNPSILFDGYKSQGEPLLLYQDSTRYYDNATQTLMPQTLWTYLNSQSPNKYKNLGIDLPKLQILDPETLPLAHSVLYYDANQFHFKLSISEKSTILYSSNYFDGWIIYIDGIQSKISKSPTHPFLEWKLEKGDHEVRLLYRPWIILCALSLVTLSPALFGVILLLIGVKSGKLGQTKSTIGLMGR